MTRKTVDAETAAQLLGAMSENPVGTVRGLVEAAIALAAPAQRKLGRIADGEVPSDDDTLNGCARDLELTRQLVTTACETLRVVIEGVRPTAPGGAA